MKEIVVLSGKGGTGKTSLVASFAALAENKVLADCDVDAADLHLVLAPRIEHSHSFSGGKKARIVAQMCSGCGECQALCRFDAITFDGPGNDSVRQTFKIDPLACEGCSVCSRFCPESAIEFKKIVSGFWYISGTRHGPMVHAKLGIAEGNSGKLVTIVRNEAKKLAESGGRDLLIVDGSPGIGCPVIASMTGADLVLAVAEPTLSGSHDLTRVMQLADHFGIRRAVAINKCDINPEIAERIKAWCTQTNTPLLGTIPYDNGFTEAQVKGLSLIEYADNRTAHAVKEIWFNVLRLLDARQDLKKRGNDERNAQIS